MKRWYSTCMVAKKVRGKARVEAFTYFCTANSKEVADALAMQEMLKRFPLSDGWKAHGVETAELDEVIAKLDGATLVA